MEPIDKSLNVSSPLPPKNSVLVTLNAKSKEVSLTSNPPRLEVAVLAASPVEKNYSS